jgi:hypothetical protein
VSDEEPVICDSTMEPHYSVAQVVEIWHLSRRTVIRIFDEEEGVMKLGRAESRYRKRYFTMRIPESVMKRVHSKLTQ